LSPACGSMGSNFFAKALWVCVSPYRLRIILGLFRGCANCCSAVGPGVLSAASFSRSNIFPVSPRVGYQISHPYLILSAFDRHLAHRPCGPGLAGKNLAVVEVKVAEAPYRLFENEGFERSCPVSVLLKLTRPRFAIDGEPDHVVTSNPGHAQKSHPLSLL
jgi:hypothetical protein